MSEHSTSDGCDIVVVGASAGGVEALQRLVAPLESGYAGSIFVVLHVSSHGKSVLPGILGRATCLAVAHAVDGEPIEPGRIYVAPPDFHLLVGRTKVELTRGPRENGYRPAIDALFRSASESHDGRVVGVVLSGTLDDGTDGLRTITDRGGTGIAQDPEEALYPTMPASAIAYGGRVEILPVDRIAARLEQLAAAGRPAGNPGKENDVNPTRSNPGPHHSNSNGDDGEGDAAPGSFLTCPDCGGVLTEIDERGVIRFRCRIGHRYSEQSLVALHRDGLEYALWVGVRALKERADLSSRVAERFRARGHEAGARRFERDAEASLGAMSTLQRTIGALEPASALEEGVSA